MASWSRCGAVPAAGSRASSARSARSWNCRSVSFKGDNRNNSVFFSSVERFGFERVTLLDEFLHALLRFLQALLAGAGEFNPALKGFQGFFQTLLAGFHFFHDLFQFREGGFKVGSCAGFFYHEASIGMYKQGLN